MDFLTDLGKKITETAKTVSKKSEDLVEITKLNLAIGNEEDKIKRMICEIGSEIYKHYLDGETFGEYFDEKCSLLKGTETEISQIKEKILSLKGSKLCKNCDEVIDYVVNYCPNCGAKAEMPVFQEKTEDMVVEFTVEEEEIKEEKKK
jgi:RNA polymerase subunit RPABC4/transcription elongation factor Spt4